VFVANPDVSPVGSDAWPANSKVMTANSQVSPSNLLMSTASFDAPRASSEVHPAWAKGCPAISGASPVGCDAKALQDLDVPVHAGTQGIRPRSALLRARLAKCRRW
jgi:hypothetical protein